MLQFSEYIIYTIWNSFSNWPVQKEDIANIGNIKGLVNRQDGIFMSTETMKKPLQSRENRHICKLHRLQHQDEVESLK